MQVYIYCLKDPDTNEIRYIGKTTNYKRRLSAHISEAKRLRGRRHVLNWIYSLIVLNKKPILEIIETCDILVWEEREKHWISYYKETCNLCNIADGGMGGSGSKNYSQEELEVRRIAAINTMSKFSQDEKTVIWELIQQGKTFVEIKFIYPEYSRHMHFGIPNGRQWNSITGIEKRKGRTRRRVGYTYNQGRYLVREIINGKKRTKFSSKIESDVVNYLNVDR